MKLLQSLIENSPVDLHEDEKLQRSFSKSFWDLGVTDKVQHKFNTRYSITLITPQSGKAVTTTPFQNRVRECNSSWESPVVLATKKDGNSMLCVDYRRLNFVTVKDYSLCQV